MKKICLLLILFSFAAFSNNVENEALTTNKIDTSKVNENTNDVKIGEQYLPIKKINEKNSTGSYLIDRRSITLHPYNDKIRIFTVIVNYDPALKIEMQDGSELPYSSAIIKQFANCDKMELAKGETKLFEKHFGEGNLIKTDNTPRRWVAISNNNKLHQLLLIACSLPIVNQ